MYELSGVMAIDEDAAGQLDWWSAKRAWQVVAFGLVAVASGWLLLGPIYQPETECAGGATHSSTGELISSWDTCRPPRSMLVEGVTTGEVPPIAWLVGAPILLAALPLLARGRAWTVLSAASAVCLVAFVVLGGFALGPLFVPGTLCAVVGAMVRRRRRAGATPSSELSEIP